MNNLTLFCIQEVRSLAEGHCKTVLGLSSYLLMQAGHDATTYWVESENGGPFQ